MDPHDPLSTFCRALQTTVGWSIVVVGTMCAGYWLGMWIGLERLPNPAAAVFAIAWASVAWLLFPGVLVGVAVMALAWYLPLKIESLWLYVSAAVVNLLTWIVIAAFVFREVRDWW